MSFVAAAGIAASTALLTRSGTTPGVYEARCTAEGRREAARFVHLR